MTSMLNPRNGRNLFTVLCLTLFSSILISAQIPSSLWDQIPSPSRTGSILKLLENENFGFSSDISGSTIVVGAFGDATDENGLNEMENAGAVFFIEKGSTSNWEDGWEIRQKVVASDREAGDFFGGSVAIHGDLAIIGAESKTFYPDGLDPLNYVGAAYLFKRDHIGIWAQFAKLVPNSPSEFALFGYAVDLSDRSILVGAPGDSYDENGENYMLFAGAAYGFEFVGDEWIENQKLVAFDREPEDFYGASIKMEATDAYVGAPHEDHDENGLNPLDRAGSVYLFDWEANADLVAGLGWIEDADGTPKITSGVDRDAGDQFGYSLAGDGFYLIVGAPEEDEDAAGENFLPDAGGAYLFYNDDIEGLNLIYKIIPENRQAESNFGISVDVSLFKEIARPYIPIPILPDEGNFLNLMIGSSGDNTDADGLNGLLGAGSLSELIISISPTIVEKKAAPTHEIIYNQKLAPPNREAGDNFGISVAMEGNILVVGANLKDYIENSDTTANAGAIYILDLCPATYDSITVAYCDTFVSPSGKYFWTEPGLYNDTIRNVAGCDSIITIELVLTSIDNSVSQDGNSLLSDEPDAEYQWLNCDIDNMPVAGATGKSFSPDESGNYAVQLIKGPCTDTSECYSITVTSIFDKENIKAPNLFPNPGTGAFSIDLGENYSDIDIEIFNAIGQSIMIMKYDDLRIIDFKLDGPEGIYTVALKLNNDKVYRLRLIKQ